MACKITDVSLKLALKKLTDADVHLSASPEFTYRIIPRLRERSFLIMQPLTTYIFGDFTARNAKLHRVLLQRDHIKGRCRRRQQQRRRRQAEGTLSAIHVKL